MCLACAARRAAKPSARAASARYASAVGVGTTGLLTWSEAAQGALATIGIAEPLPRLQTIAELRLLRILVGLGVGAALALSGGLLQGVFRNDLASPSIVGISAGAGLGASIVILLIGGRGPRFLFEASAGNGPMLVALAAFAGGVGVAWMITRLSTVEGRISVPTLLLVGVAVNAVAASLIAALQWLSLESYEASQALFAWLFGRLDDRTALQAAIHVTTATASSL